MGPSKRSAISPFIVMEVMKAANERELSGGNVLHLEVGQPSTPAPRGVLAAAKAALDTDRLGYTEALGIPALRERITGHYKDYYGVDIAAERIVVTTGSSGAFSRGLLRADRRAAPQVAEPPPRAKFSVAPAPQPPPPVL